MKKFSKPWWWCLAMCLVAIVAAAEPTPQSVRFVYLVSSDRSVREDFRIAIEDAAVDLRGWYGRQLDGATFRLNDPVVEVAQSGKDAGWFYSNPNGGDHDSWGFNNGLAEAKRLVGAKHDDPNFIWIVYSDGPGNKGRGGNGIAVLPEDDLLGLIGAHPVDKDVSRWIAGLGHELGHALGLAHPDDTVKDADALMYTGIYGKYPNQTYLTLDDIARLKKSPFIFHPDGSPVSTPGAVIEKYAYKGGAFVRYESAPLTDWMEIKTDNPGVALHFKEVFRNTEEIRLFDGGRNMTIRLPVAGGWATWSTDGEKTWNTLFQVWVDPSGSPVSTPGVVVEKYAYNGGAFVRYETAPLTDWTEIKTDNPSVALHFKEVFRNEEEIRLFDGGRNMTIRLPVAGGWATWSIDGEKTWNTLFQVWADS